MKNQQQKCHIINTKRKINSKTMKSRVSWDKMIITDKQVMHNRPDIQIIQKLNLAHGLKAIYQLKQDSVHPLIISANGLIELKKEFTKIELNEAQKTILTVQKAAILGTCRTVRLVLTND